jgi:hypothetical protein
MSIRRPVNALHNHHFTPHSFSNHELQTKPDDATSQRATGLPDGRGHGQFPENRPFEIWPFEIAGRESGRKGM